LSPLRLPVFFEDTPLAGRPVPVLATDFDARRPAGFLAVFFAFPDNVEEVFFAGFFGDLLLLDFLFEALFFCFKAVSPS
jgi:hypothetical protein